MPCCPACNAISGRADAAGRVYRHEQPACPFIPQSAMTLCVGCGKAECSNDCERRRTTHLERSFLAQAVQAAHDVRKGDPRLDVLFPGTFGYPFPLTNSEVNEEGLRFNAIHRGKVPQEFDGVMKVTTAEDGTAVWTAARRGELGALSVAGFLARYSAAAIPGNESEAQSAVLEAGGLPRAGNGDSEALEDVRRQLKEAHDTIRQMVDANERLAQGQVDLAIPMVGKGTAKGALSRATVAEAGKDLLSLSAVLAEAGFFNGVVMKRLPVTVTLTTTEAGGKAHKLELRVFNPGAITYIDRGILLRGFEAQSQVCGSLLRLYGSENLLPEGWYKPSDLVHLVDAVLDEAQRAAQSAGRGLMQFQGGAVMESPRLYEQICVIDEMLGAAIHHAISRNAVLHPNDAIFLAARARVGPRLAVTYPVHRQGDPVQQIPQNAEEPKKKKAREEPSGRIKQERSEQLCRKYNKGSEPCAGKTTCPEGRKHACNWRGCKETHPRKGNH